MVAVGVFNFGVGGRAENTVSGGAGGQYIWNRSLRFPTVMMNDGRSHHCRLTNPFPFINTL